MNLRKISTLCVYTALAVMFTPLHAAEEIKEEKRPFTWWNDVPDLVKRGVEEYKNSEFKPAEDKFRDAEFRTPGNAVVQFNQGLAQARQEEFESAAASFGRSSQLSGADAKLRALAQYNKGVAHLSHAKALDVEAQKLKDKKKQESLKARALQAAFDSLDSFNESLALDPENEDTIYNKSQAQHYLQYRSMMEEMMQQQQQQQNSEQGEGDPDPNQKNEDEGEKQDQEKQEGDQQEQDPGEGEQEEQEGKENEGGDEPQEGEQQPQSGEESEQEEKEGRSGGGAEQKEGRPLTEEEAKQLLNLLGDEEQIQLRKGRGPVNKPAPEKPW